MKCPIDDVLHQVGQVAVVANDEMAQLPPQRMVRRDAEVAADVGDDGADRTATDLVGDLLGRGYRRVRPGDKGRGGGFGGPGGGAGGWRSAVGGSAWRRGLGVQFGGCADDPGFERLGTEKAAGDAREDQSDVAGAERVLVVAERGGELPAVVDELADEADEPAGTAGFGGGCGGLGGGHEQTRNIDRRPVSRNLFPVILANQ